MSRWWRAYDEAVDDPKLQQLPPALAWVWFNLCCITSQNGGNLPPIGDIAFKLRSTPAKARRVIDELRTAGLIDDDDDGMRPHNWNARQFKSDVTDPTAAERMKRYRKKNRNETVTPTVTVTPPRAEQIPEQKTEQIPEATASAPDVRTDLFGRGLKTLANITGKTPDSCRSLVGKWLKTMNDEAIHVLAAIDDAERNRVADPVAWINRALKPNGANGHGKRNIQDAALDLVDQIKSFDDPVPSDLRSGEGACPIRRLPPR